jgi:hypothetical protein
MKTISIEVLAEKINGKIWQKENITRIYVNAGFNTKKMSTKAFIYQLEDGTYKVSCSIYCPSQPMSWVKSQEEKTIESISEEILEIIEEFGFELEAPAAPIEEVKGYYMKWHEVKVAVNGYGKMEMRKRQKVHTYVGSKLGAPKGFVELSDEHFEQAKQAELKETLFSYAETLEFA